ncbi:bS18 family ribosomal protein [Nonomuraea diastatica]|uniref:Uncharacterized protein n=1 Tax=Nonomuraea diastatica TaxID=1848329 RepID=A0A4R4WJS0_9ACTN|nr:hypothetical protein E1294_21345 [Nonomuraea diastatica]
MCHDGENDYHRSNRVTGVTVQQQRQIAKAIEFAREMALLPPHLPPQRMTVPADNPARTSPRPGDHRRLGEGHSWCANR